MKHRRQDLQEQEPLGIVISSGARGDQQPRFSAYVWSDAPEQTGEPTAVEPTARRAA